MVHVHDAAEAVLDDELEWHADILRQPGIAAAEDDRVDEQVKVVDEFRGDQRRRRDETGDQLG